MTIFPGFILSRLAEWARLDAEASDRIAIDNHQANGVHGVHQARVRLAGDSTVYRLIIAPPDAPIAIDGRDAATYFAAPLGDG
jgi:divalent metal cation (Fe/Co/Zn/Cd) transporter